MEFTHIIALGQILVASSEIWKLHEGTNQNYSPLPHGSALLCVVLQTTCIWKKQVTCFWIMHFMLNMNFSDLGRTWYHEREKHYWYQQEGWTVMKDCFLSQGKCRQVYCKLSSVAILQWKITYLEFISFFVTVRLRRNGKVSLFLSLSCMIIDFTAICWESRVGPSVTASQR